MEPWGRGANDIDVLTSAARERVPDAVVWRGDPDLQAVNRGLKVFGVPIGHPEYVQEFLRRKSEEQQVLFQRVPLVNDPQASWLFLWMCASNRVSPELTLPFAMRHDNSVWQCVQCLLTIVDSRELSERSKLRHCH